MLNDIKYILNYYKLKYKEFILDNSVKEIRMPNHRSLYGFIIVREGFFNMSFNKDKGWDSLLGRMYAALR